MMASSTAEKSVAPAPAGNRWHAFSSHETLVQLGSTAVQGLAVAEAAKRLREFGPNALPEAKHRSLWRVFFRQFQSPLIYILFLAAALAFAMGKRGDAGVILIVVFLNALIGTFQEGRAERSMESLRRLSTLKVRVLRGGKEEIIEARKLVPGDILLLGCRRCRRRRCSPARSGRTRSRPRPP